MDNYEQYIRNFRDPSPCHNCTERFIACSDHCPKDERGEFGYKAWKAEGERVKENRRAYLKSGRRYKFDWRKNIKNGE
jgi:hypothetical protein